MANGKANHRNRQAVPNLPHDITIQQGELYAGPIPSPEILEKFKTVDASFPERIMQMAEQHAQADVRTKNRFSLSLLLVPLFGQLFSLLLGLGGIAACVFLARTGFTGAAIAAIVASFAPIVIAALKNLFVKN
jgi:uncharacterized membrane protein